MLPAGNPLHPQETNLMKPSDAYRELLERTRRIATLQSCTELLGWEERTTMPRGGAGHRAAQLALLAGLAHQWLVDPRLGELLGEAEAGAAAGDADAPQAANLREIRRRYERAVRLPQALVEEMAHTTSLAQGEWQEARRRSDFEHFRPWLEKIVDLVRRAAGHIGWQGEPYDALLDEYEPGMTAARVAAIFEALRPELVALNRRIAEAPHPPDPGILQRPFDPERQRIFGEMVASAMGFDFARGRLDVTTHPFCAGIGPGDTRITTRYNPQRLNDALFGIMHEAGHALYEMGLDKEAHFGTPLGEAVSLGIHESQSRLWENQVGRSRAFWSYFFPQAQRIFRDSLGDVTLDAFYGAVNHVQPSHIRVEADEATYNLHILLRFELERALVAGELAPAEVPDAWNRRFRDTLGLAVENDAQGCLQDIHWSSGGFGYFPTYTLGNLYAAQFFAQARRDLPDLEDRIARGDLAGLGTWLRETIHRHGSRYPAAELVQRVTGAPLSHRPLMDYLERKFGEVYGF